jgi:hypothetical protein
VLFQETIVEVFGHDSVIPGDWEIAQVRSMHPMPIGDTHLPALLPSVSVRLVSYGALCEMVDVWLLKGLYLTCSSFSDLDQIPIACSEILTFGVLPERSGFIGELVKSTVCERVVRRVGVLSREVSDIVREGVCL